MIETRLLDSKIKMGKRSVKCHAIRKLETLGKRSLSYLRDTFPDESNDSGLGSDGYPSFHESNSSSGVEESDLDSSSESVDSSNSRLLRLPKQKRLIPNDGLDQSLSSSYSILQIDSSLALSLNNKMHIQHSQSDTKYTINDSSCLNEPSAKRRKIYEPSADLSDNSSVDTQESQENIISFAKDSIRNDFGNKDSSNGKDGSEWSSRNGFLIRGAPGHSSRNGDRIAALLSSNSNSLAKKRAMKKPSLHVCFPSRSKDGKIDLCILIQPEEQHRARYMTEGSRGSIKDEKGTGFPTVKLVGYSQPVVLQIFIGSDQGKVQPHLFYQACKVTGKNCTPCTERVIDGTCVIEINMMPETEMTVSCDCIGILKERNVDVEQRLPYFGLARCKKRSTKCRMVFRVNIPLANGNYETLQVASSQILCTQSPGLPEICKKSLIESPASGGQELFIIGKNFQKDAKVVFQEFSDVRNGPCHGKNIMWEEMVDPEKEYIHQSHLICSVPPYRDPELRHPVKVFLSVLSGGKSSEPHTFTYTPPLPGNVLVTNCHSFKSIRSGLELLSKKEWHLI